MKAIGRTGTDILCVNESRPKIVRECSPDRHLPVPPAVPRIRRSRSRAVVSAHSSRIPRFNSILVPHPARTALQCPPRGSPPRDRPWRPELRDPTKKVGDGSEMGRCSSCCDPKAWMWAGGRQTPLMCLRQVSAEDGRLGARFWIGFADTGATRRAGLRPAASTIRETDPSGYRFRRGMDRRQRVTEGCGVASEVTS